jgi:hypothetical protein
MKERAGHFPKDQEGSPAFSRVVEGHPIEVQDRELIPLVRVTSWLKRRATLRGDEVEAQGYGFVHLRPVGLVERRADTQHRHRIRDETMHSLLALGLAFLLVPCAATLLIHFVRRARLGGASTESA